MANKKERNYWDKEPEKLISVNDASKKLGISKSTIARWCRNGTIRGAYRLNTGVRSAWLIPESEFETEEMNAHIITARTMQMAQAPYQRRGRRSGEPSE
jgi:excisionase family DNA binding protein